MVFLLKTENIQTFIEKTLVFEKILKDRINVIIHYIFLLNNPIIFQQVLPYLSLYFNF